LCLLRDGFEREQDLIVATLGCEEDAEGLGRTAGAYFVDVAAQMACGNQSHTFNISHGDGHSVAVVSGEGGEKGANRLIAPCCAVESPPAFVRGVIGHVPSCFK